MGNFYLQSNQNWSTSAWYTLATGGELIGTRPGDGDVMYLNNKVLTIDTVESPINLGSTGSIEGGNLNGRMMINSDNLSGITFTAHHFQAGTSYGLFYVSGSGIINISGEVRGGQYGSGYGVKNGGPATINITGNVIGGSSAVGLINESSGIINIDGDSIGGTGNPGCNNYSTGTINIYGDSIGVGNIPGAANANVGTINVTGTVIPGTGAEGIQNNNPGGSLHLNVIQFINNGYVPVKGQFATGNLTFNRLELFDKMYTQINMARVRVGY